MKKNKYILLMIMLFFIASCGYDASEENISEKPVINLESDAGKSQFIINTKTLSEYNEESNIEKIGKIISSETIDLKSEASGRISGIYVKKGDKVNAGQVIGKIKDMYSKYYLDLENAQINYDAKLISKDSQLIVLEDTISNTKISLDEAKLNYENAKITAEEDLKEAKLNYENSDLVDTSSQAYLDLEKSKLDYDNILNSNKQQINTYVSNVKKEYNNLYLSLNDVIKFSDELFGVTDDYEDDNDEFEDYLGAKDTRAKKSAEDSLIQLMKYRDDLEKLDVDNINEENIIEFMDSFYLGYEKIDVLLGYIEDTLNNSISSAGSFSSSDISGYSSQVNSYQSSNQGNLSSFTSTKSSITSFLNTYKNDELSSLKNIELKEKQLEDSGINGKTTYNKKIVSIENSLNLYKVKYEQAQLSYDKAISNKSVSIRSLDNSISSAKNSLDKARLEYSKLTIVSPISGYISDISVDTSSSVSVGTNLFDIVGDNKTKIEVSLNSDEINLVNIGDKVKVNYLNKEIYGEVYSKSSVANESLEYNLEITLSENIDLIGDSTFVEFISKNENLILPVSIIEIIGENKGYIYYLNENKAEKIEVDLGKVDGINVEILSELDENLEVITTDLKNYNELNQTLIVNDNK